MTLITLAHGSRHEGTAAVIDNLTAAAGSCLGETAVSAYLELQRPVLRDVVTELARQGHRHAIVVPLLFTDAYHARHDAPRALHDASDLGVQLMLAPPLGLGDEIASLLVQVIKEDTDSPIHVVLWAVGSSDQVANERMRALGVTVAKRAGYSVTTLFATRGGLEALQKITQKYSRVHLLPLFVAPGLLFDLAMNSGCAFSYSLPLGSRLAEVVARRYEHARRSG
ncbi:sirohydrochlorin chelatase [Corynebacterium lowii]|uniref:Sirohydrochlorin ferrochelatase n=1 Tax=Corynebacterium lowii TaxID=1544413 RepID=A0A0Q1E0U7_9CORY|nr:sirohydrochlorin chelatase [Corynebacterium lowii]KQB86095.1 Sirohydrochlorin ferrochelatase [Corynebacterium lowii]MDP9852568.1 sirohydrochlorin ferrochelatase [Corynebacterium lowii]